MPDEPIEEEQSGEYVRAVVESQKREREEGKEASREPIRVISRDREERESQEEQESRQRELLERVKKEPIEEELPSSYVREVVQSQQGIDTTPKIIIGTRTSSPETIIRTPEITQLEVSSPQLFKTLTEQGYDAYKKKVGAERFVQQQSIKQFERVHTKLPDGQYVANEDLARIKREDAKLYYILTTKGIEAGEQHISAQESKNRQAILALSNYTDKQGNVRVSDFLKDNPNKEQVLRDAGIGNLDIQRAKGFITLTKEIQKSPALPVSKKDVMFGASEKVTSTIPLTEKQIARIEKFSAGMESALTMIPVLGTGLLISKEAPVKTIALSAAFDILAFAPVFSWIGKIKYINKIPGFGKVESIIRSSRRVERATLKALTDKKTVKAYDDMVKTGDEYAQNYALVRHTEKIMKTRPGGALPEDKVTLEITQKKIASLTEQLKQKADTFAKIQKEGISKKKNIIIGSDTQAILSDFGTKYQRGIKNVIDQIYDGKIPKIKTLTNQIKSLTRDLKVAEYSQDIPEINRLTAKLIRVKQQLKIANSGELVNIITQRNKQASIIEDNLRKIAKLKTAQPKTIVENQRIKKEIVTLNNSIKKLRLSSMKLNRQASNTMKNLEIEWAEPLPLSSGRGLPPIFTKPKTSSKYIGGGLRVGYKSQVSGNTIYAMQGAKLIFTSSDGIEEWSIPGVIVIKPPGKETIRVEPQPYWSGEVTTKPKPSTKPTEPFIPETKPIEKPPFDPKPGKITWTPSIVVSPRVTPEGIVEFTTEPRSLSKAQAQAVAKSITEYMNQVAHGTSPNTAAKSITKTSQGIVVNPVTSTKQQIALTTAIIPSSIPRANIVTEITPLTSITPTPITTTTTTIEKGIPKVPLPVTTIKLKKSKAKSKNKKEKLAKIPFTWRQGIVWWTIDFPYQRQSDIRKPSRKPPKDAKIIKGGLGSALKTLQALGGDINLLVNIDVGAFDFSVFGKGKKMIGKFTRDIKGRTKGDLTLKGVRK